MEKPNAIIEKAINAAFEQHVAKLFLNLCVGHADSGAVEAFSKGFEIALDMREKALAVAK